MSERGNSPYRRATGERLVWGCSHNRDRRLWFRLREAPAVYINAAWPLPSTGGWPRLRGTMPMWSVVDCAGPAEQSSCELVGGEAVAGPLLGTAIRADGYGSEPEMCCEQEVLRMGNPFV